MTDISKDFDAAIETSAKKASETLTGTLLNLAKEQIPKVKIRLKTGFKEISKHQYEKCSRVKTLLYRHDPVHLLKIYVPTKFETRQTHENMSDINLIENASTGNRRYIITGLAGSGKSIFTKFLCLELIKRQNIFPIFIELRDLNDEHEPSILHLIQKRFSSVTGDFTLSQLQYGLRQGVFFLILDAFDELNLNIRPKIEREILEISETYIKCGLVVSARPSPVFDSWPNFSEATVLPLSEHSVAELITKLEFDHIIKEKFLTRLPELFSTHSEFLSNPLLATMMLLTFDQFGDVPNKIHIFYEQAFLTLFYTHDALKSAFVRQSYSKLPVDDFRRYMSAFCYITYLDEAFVFDRESLSKYAKMAKSIEQINVDESLWLKDLTDSLCLLVVDGDSISFAHRSFQEYFAALFFVHNEIADEDIIDELFLRIPDDVCSLVFSLDKNKMETDYIIPILQRFIQKAGAINIIEDPGSYLYILCDECSFDTKWEMLSWEGTKISDSFIIIDRIFGLYYGPIADMLLVLDVPVTFHSREEAPVTFHSREEANDLLKKTNFPSSLKNFQKEVVDLLKTIQENHENKRNLLSEIVLKRKG